MSKDKKRYLDYLPDKLPNNPMHIAYDWFNEALKVKDQPNPDAMSLATMDNHRPSVRMVLCKSFVPDPGYIVIYTNYQSQKVQEISLNSNVSLVFHWDHLGKQIRIDGIAVRSPVEESDKYFNTRSQGSQISAWGSDQSQLIESRDALKEQIENRATKLGLSKNKNKIKIERPSYWGGIRIWASKIELWLEGQDRIHDRAMWTREIKKNIDNQFMVSNWIGCRLQP